MRPTSRPTPAALPLHEQEPLVAPAPVQAKPAAAVSKFGLLVLAGANVGQRFRLGGQGCQVGRTRGALLFADDPFVSAHHATFLIRDGRLYVRDEGSASGVLVTVHQELLRPGTLFSAGERLFRYSGALEPTPPSPGRAVVYGAPLPQAVYLVEEILVGGRAGRAVITQGPLLTIGQSHCDLSFPGDEGMAARHCELSPSPTGATLRDLSGGLGTFVHLAGSERPLASGDLVRIGEQVLQVETLA
jgi:pSer/pThr/pTyr-binding forkhead associated (FHA) protein